MSGQAGAIGYRPEIDGLRAIAVLAVVLYHFGLPALSGGFVGVDIFFVLSGFLIGGILWSELIATGRIRLGAFYLRRIRRLAPAYFAMAAASFLVAWFVLLPFEFRAFGKALIAATVYLSNVNFYREAGYFDIGAEDKVLLHTWSLAVEEQFYIVLPFALLLLIRWRRALPTLLAGAAILSLLACVRLTATSPTAAFYLFPFRAWELLAGVLLAIAGQQRGLRWVVHPVLSWAGLGLVLAGIVLITPGPGFPGLQALVPVIGTVLILANGRDANPVNRALSHPAPVFIGVISYSLYLWHWPVLTLSQYWRGGYSGGLEAALWLALAFGISVLSWRYVERPVRRMRGPATLPLVGGTVLASGVLLALGALIWKGDGMAGRFAPFVRTHIEASGDFNQDWSHCVVAEAGPLVGVETCPVGPDGPPEVLIWGDSHLRAMKEGVERAAFVAGRPALVIWHAGCPPLFGVTKTESAATPAQDADCTRANATIRKGLSQIDSLKTLLLVGRWSYYTEGQGSGLDAHNRIALAPAPDSNLPVGPQHTLFNAALTRTLAELAPQFGRIFVLRQMPEVPDYDSRRIARALAHGRMARGDDTVFKVPLAEALARAAPAEAPLAALASAGRITWIDGWPRLCDVNACSVMQGGEAWYFDNNHLTNRAAIALSDLFVPVFAAPEAAQ
ncbi:Peptidoglycan/LPS O-acetylase OafA/YrhL, contains acyltransferase and SGNH-hydrolase domains [Roseovarius lutimaris]|uniref:Peptidoglycan/LPS O-acetylase OafA/YrhL, contains acyltransferase and SGNH-hydrolase domains n=1 Tax=Roseovarius lutimaris TaxID=1005928 RepID=A0A1I5E9B8_9RHOB|nr:acyltransferase family protein [Roseovarius lutimaris]SFO08139.1 Peptidoglycan/LPS O-acetylase OafA/YrhL, contains acyltransferase and SGNH-hydrolase domains [Roseovarius lutimaris]